MGEYDKASEYLSLAERARKSFVEEFWDPQKDCLFDTVHIDGKRDDSLRPNQIFAASLDFSMLNAERAEKTIDIVWRQLWGEYGLKTLSSGDSRYMGKYGGSWQQRDNSYHNGTVWPWLLGPFVTAFLKLKGYAATWRGYAYENFLRPLFEGEICRAGLGTVSEIFDGDSPHESKGCIAQAWSVAEPLRAYVEDVLLQRPSYEREVLRQ